MLFKSFFGMLLALFLAPAINSQRLCCYRMVIGNLWDHKDELRDDAVGNMVPIRSVA